MLLVITFTDSLYLKSLDRKRAYLRESVLTAERGCLPLEVGRSFEQCLLRRLHPLLAAQDTAGQWTRDIGHSTLCQRGNLWRKLRRKVGPLCPVTVCAFFRAHVWKETVLT